MKKQETQPVMKRFSVSVHIDFTMPPKRWWQENREFWWHDIDTVMAPDSKTAEVFELWRVIKDMKSRNKDLLSFSVIDVRSVEIEEPTGTRLGF